MAVPNLVAGVRTKRVKVERAREFRREMTPEERLLWQALRKNQLAGIHFRRQHIIDGFIVDFYCHAAALVIEVDGTVHGAQAEADAARDEALRLRGLAVLRFANEQIRTDLPAILAAISRAVHARL